MRRRQATVTMTVALVAGVAAAAMAGQTRFERLWGQMTGAEQHRATLFPEFAERIPITDAPDGNLVAVRPLYGGEVPDIPDVVRDLVCAAGTVFAGSVDAGVSHPTAGGHSVFTDSRVRVTAVLRAPGGLPSAGEERVVSRPGGSFAIGGATYGVDHSGFPPLVPGRQYIFFSTFVEEADSFLAKSPGSVYHCAAGMCERLGVGGQVTEVRLHELVLGSDGRCR